MFILHECGHHGEVISVSEFPDYESAKCAGEAYCGDYYITTKPEYDDEEENWNV